MAGVFCRDCKAPAWWVGLRSLIFLSGKDRSGPRLSWDTYSRGVVEFVVYPDEVTLGPSAEVSELISMRMRHFC